MGKQAELEELEEYTEASDDEFGMFPLYGQGADSELTETLRPRKENETIPRQLAVVERLYVQTIEDISTLMSDDTPAGGEDGDKTR